MKYTFKKQISSITTEQVKDDDGNVTGYKANIDYTINGKGVHNGVEIPINGGVRAVIELPDELVKKANDAADAAIKARYPDDKE